MPWYEIPRTGGVPMWFDRERPDLEPADAPDEKPEASEKPERPAARKPRREAPAEGEAKAD